MSTLVVIPAHNEEESIKTTVDRLEKVIKSRPEYDIDYVVINDGSTDKTKEVLEKENINHINHIVNMGVGAGIKTGIMYAHKCGYDNVTQFDGDGQHNAEYIFDLIDQVNQGYDIVIGSRWLNTKKPKSLRMLGSRILSALIYLKSGGKLRITDPTSGQRILSSAMTKKYLSQASCSEPAFVSKYYGQGFKVKEVQVQMNEREAGESHFNVVNSIKFMLEQSLAIIFGL